MKFNIDEVKDVVIYNTETNEAIATFDTLEIENLEVKREGSEKDA